VRKSASADVDEGSLGATVDLQTARPLDFKGFTATASLQGSLQRPVGSTDPRAAFLWQHLRRAATGGVVLGRLLQAQAVRGGLQHRALGQRRLVGRLVRPHRRHRQPEQLHRHHLRPGGTGRATIDRHARPPSPPTTRPAAAANFHPRLPRYGRLTHDQDRLGLTGSVQFKPAEGTLLTLDLLYAKLDATRQEDFLQAISFSRTAQPRVASRRPAWWTPPTAATAHLLYGRTTAWTFAPNRASTSYRPHSRSPR
jgi:iron complex outermembrane receptor protein